MAPQRDLIPSQAVLAQNAILSGLSAATIAEVLKTAKLVALKTSEQIYEAGLPIRDVYFPIDSVLSVVTQMRDGGFHRGRPRRPGGCLGNPVDARTTTRPTRATAKFPATPSLSAAMSFDDYSTAERAASQRARPFSSGVRKYAGTACGMQRDAYRLRAMRALAFVDARSSQLRKDRFDARIPQ